MMHFNKDLADAIDQILQEDGWNYYLDQERGLIRMSMLNEGVIKRIDFLIDLFDDHFITYAALPIGADISDDLMVAALAEFICRVNSTLMRGNFELDYDEGTIRFKDYVDCTLGLPDKRVLYTSIVCAMSMSKRYGKGIVNMIFHGRSAVQAIEECEREGLDEMIAHLEGLFEGFDPDGDPCEDGDKPDLHDASREFDADKEDRDDDGDRLLFQEGIDFDSRLN